jgi:thiamine-phosphate pyrophosphorylase
MIESFHYLTQDLAGFSHESQVKTACEAGVKWIQLRAKNLKYRECLSLVQSVKAITDQFAATLIVNDYVEVAAAANASGVHLGQNDAHWKSAREILGTQKIIGLSIHLTDELMAAKNAAVNYFGVGPFRFTTTKEKLDPLLGLEGIRRLVQFSHEHEIDIPMIAIGGISSADVLPLLQAGVKGIAVSSAVNKSFAPGKTIVEFLDLLKVFNHKLHSAS